MCLAVCGSIALAAAVDYARSNRSCPTSDPLGAIPPTAALVLGRWFAALVSLMVDPIALLLIVASTCAFY